MGCSVAKHLAERGGFDVCVLDKEYHLARHQSGRSSGVIHPGFMVQPGTTEAELAPPGARRLKEYCAEHDVPTHLGGELRIATDEADADRVWELHENGRANGVETEVLESTEEIQAVEPHAAGEVALHCPDNGTVDFEQLTYTLAREAREGGADFYMGYEVTAVDRTADGFRFGTAKGTFEADYFVNATGVYADEFAHAVGVAEEYRIVPYRGVFYELVPERRSLVRSNIYPVADPHNPIGTGIHFTRRPDDKVIVGPNFALAPSREGYDDDDARMGEVLGTLTHPGFEKRMADPTTAKWERDQLRKSYEKERFVAAAARLVPDVGTDDLVRSYTGIIVRLVDDDGFTDMQVFEHGERSSHLLAVLPGITSSIVIGEHVADAVTERL